MVQVIAITALVAVMTASIPYMSCKMTKRHFKVLVFIVFICYVNANLYFTLVSRESGNGNYINLIPFQSYRQLFVEPAEGLSAVSGLANMMLYGLTPFESTILNILLYYPLGYLLHILFSKFKIWHVILIGCLCSIATEATQYLLKMGCCETDDVIHNTLGTALGVWVWHLQSKRLNKSTQ